MSDDSTYERYGRPALKGGVLFLAAVSIASAAVQLTTEGIAAVGDVVVSSYIAALIVWGVFYDGFGTDRFRIALYAGIVLWGVTDFITGETSAVTWILLGGGALMLGQELVRKRRRDSRPVYDR